MVFWFVSHGPDASHLINVDRFGRLRDAKRFAEELPEAPTGGARPYKIERAEYTESNVHGDDVLITEVK